MVDQFGNWFAHKHCTSIPCLNEQWHCQTLLNPNKMVEEDMTIEETINDSAINSDIGPFDAFLHQIFNSGGRKLMVFARWLDKIVKEVRNFDGVCELPVF
jgi:hypothetical protein